MVNEIAARLGMRQVVKEPTRGQNILDLILTNLPAANASVHDSIDKSDHCIDLVEMKSHLHIEDNLHHVVWHYHRAKWDRLHTDLATQASASMRHYGPSTAAELYSNTVRVIPDTKEDGHGCW
eukprot:g25088.t1